MSRSRFTVAGLVTVTATAGLALAGCHSSAGTAAGSASASAPGTAAAVATASSAAVSGAGAVAYFPDQVGDTWVYSIDLDGSKGTVTNRVTAVKPVSGGTQVTETDTDTAFGSAKPFTLNYIVQSDGSITIPVNFDGGSGFKLKSGTLAWPGPAQLASGVAQKETLVMTDTAGGTTVSVTSKDVIKGEGTQSVTVPAGSYSATVVDEVETEKVMGTPVNDEIKTWLVNGIGPVKTETLGGSAASAVSDTEQLISFTKG